MTPDDAARVRELFDRVVDLDDGELQGVLASERPTVRDEVLRLVSSARSGSGFLSRPVPIASAPAPAEEAEPEQIGSYRITGRLGRGGMGVVYAGVSGEQPVAIKTVASPGRWARAAIEREVHALARLRHPGIVRVLESGTIGDSVWYAMELVRGATLREELDRLGPRRRFDPAGDPAQARLLSILAAMCPALAYIHGEGVVHRDLKPENVVVASSGLPILVDFGIATAFPVGSSREQMASGSAAGTIAYMAPEQAAGRPLDARADLYALGCILHELVTGQVPDPRRRTQPRGPRAPSRLVANVPPALDALVLRLLAPEPRSRAGYATDVSDALRKLLPPRDEPRGSTSELETAAYLFRPELSGREQLLEEWEAHLLALQRGESGVVLATGEGGIGKTRLAMEMAARARRLGIQVFTTACTPPEGAASAPLQPFRALLASISTRSGTPAEAARLLGEEGHELATIAPELRELPLPPAPAPPPVAEPDAAGARARRALRTLLERLAPLVLVVDDLHFADGSTVALVAELASEPPRERAILLVATQRSDEAPLLPRIDGASRVATLEVGRLDEAAIRGIVSDSLGGELPSGLAEQLAVHATGNPFVVGEYLQAARASGLLVRLGGRWVLTDPLERLDQPASVRQLLERRLERLGEAARHVARIASLVGRRLDGAVLATASGLERDVFLDAVVELMRRGVLDDEPGELRFRHGQLLEAARASIPRSEAPALHRAIADAAEGLPGALGALELGGHWEAASDPGRALESYRAGLRPAIDVYDLGCAEALFRACLRLEHDPAKAAGLHRDLATHVLRLQGRWDEGTREASTAFDIARGTGEQELEATCLFGRALVAQEASDPRAAAALYEEALERSERAGLRRLEAAIRANLALLAATQGRLEDARRGYEAALTIGRELDDARFVAHDVGSLGAVERMLGDLAHAREHLAESLDGHVAGKELLYGSVARLEVTRLLVDMGLPEVALDLALVARDGFRRTGERRWEALTLSLVARLLAERGTLAEAESLARQAERTQRELGNLPGLAAALGAVAAVQVELGRLEDARATLDEALAIGERSLDTTELPALLRQRARVDRYLGRLGSARESLDQAEARLRDPEQPAELGRCLLERGRLEIASEGNPFALLPELDALAARVPGLARSLSWFRDAARAFRDGRRLLWGDREEEIPGRLRLRLQLGR